MYLRRYRKKISLLMAGWLLLAGAMPVGGQSADGAPQMMQESIQESFTEAETSPEGSGGTAAEEARQMDELKETLSREDIGGLETSPAPSEESTQGESKSSSSPEQTQEAAQGQPQDPAVILAGAGAATEEGMQGAEPMQDFAAEERSSETVTTQTDPLRDDTQDFAKEPAKEASEEPQSDAQEDETDQAEADQAEADQEDQERTLKGGMILTLPDAYYEIVVDPDWSKQEQVIFSIIVEEGQRLTRVGAFEVANPADFYAAEDPMEEIGAPVALKECGPDETGASRYSFAMPSCSVLLLAQTAQIPGSSVGGPKKIGQKVTVNGDKADFALTLGNLAAAQCDYPKSFLKSGYSAVTTVKPYNVVLSDGTTIKMLAGFCLQADPKFGTYGAGEQSVSYIDDTERYRDLVKALYLLSVNPKSGAFTTAGLWGQSVLVNGEEVNFKKLFTGNGKGEAGLTNEEAFAMAHVVISKLYWLAQGSPDSWTWNAGSGDAVRTGGSNILNEDGVAFVNKVVSLIQDAQMIDASIRKGTKASASFTASECSYSGDVLVSPTFVWSTIPSNTLTFTNLPAGITIVDETTGRKNGKVAGGSSFHVEAAAALAGETIELAADAAVFSGGGAFRSPGGGSNQDLGFAAVTNTAPVMLGGTFPLMKPIRITKYDKETGKAAPQNSAAAFAGAVYGIFSDRACTKGVDSVTIGADGIGTSKRLPGGTYYVKETQPPVGYEADTVVYSVSVTNDTAQVYTVKSTEQIYRGGLSLMKFLDDNSEKSYLQQLYDSGILEGIKFELRHEDPSVPKVTISTDRYGYASTSSDALVYGRWTIHEVPESVPEAYHSMADTTVMISGNHVQYRYVLSNHQPQVQVKLVKKDAQTGNEIPIAHAKFQVLDQTGTPISMPFNLDVSKVRDTFETNEDGVIVFYKPFGAGTYTLREVAPPAGYLKAPDQTFRITTGTPTDEPFVVTVYDEPVRGRLTITKQDASTGEPIDDVVFALYAAEDITDAFGAVRTMQTSEGEVALCAGTMVAQVTTREGTAQIEDLYLGNYTLQEVSAAEGYVRNETPIAVTMTTSDTDENCQAAVTLENEKTSFDLFKAASDDGSHFLPGVVYRIFSSADVAAKQAEIIAQKLEELRESQAPGREAFTARQEAERSAYEQTLQDLPAEEQAKALEDFLAAQRASAQAFEDQLQAQVDALQTRLMEELQVEDTSDLGREYTTDEEGHIHLEDLSHSTVYSLYEIRTRPGYNLDTTVYTFEVDDQGRIEGLKGKELLLGNEPNILRISKRDITGDEELPGAELTVRDEEGNQVDQWISSDTPHEIRALPAGNYTLTELQPPAGYSTAETISFTVKDSLEIQTVVMRDAPLSVSISKADMTTGEELPGASLQIKDAAGRLVEEWISEDTPHLVHLPEGSYTLTETLPPSGYATANTISFTVADQRVVQEVVMEDAPLTVEVSKKDMTTGEELPGARLQITDADGKLVEEWVSEKEPHMVHLAQGDYTLTEITAPKGYKKAVSISFTVEDTARIQKVEMLDEQTQPPVNGEAPKPDETAAPGTGTVKTGDPFRYFPALVFGGAGLALLGLAISPELKRRRAGNRGSRKAVR